MLGENQKVHKFMQKEESYFREDRGLQDDDIQKLNEKEAEHCSTIKSLKEVDVFVQI